MKVETQKKCYPPPPPILSTSILMKNLKILSNICICNDCKCEEWCFCSKIKIECPFADIETYSNFEKKLCSRGNKLK
jgi:hypothetical protein